MSATDQVPSSTDDGAPVVLKFEPWQSAVDPAFWAELARRKLDSLGLSEDPVKVTALYAPAHNASVSSPAQLDRASFVSNEADPAETLAAYERDAVASGRLRMPGVLRNVNTFERFTGADRNAILGSAARDLWRDIVSGAAEENPALLNPFTVLTFADLKKWAFYYWFAFPALKLQTPVRVARVDTVVARLGLDSSRAFADACDEWLKAGGAPAWLVVPVAENGFRCHPLKAFGQLSDAVLAFADPCAAETHPGWALRNLCALATVRWRLTELDAVCVRRAGGRVSHESSLWHELRLPPQPELDLEGPCPAAVGWEVNAKGRAGPRVADLGASMDPARLAAQAVDLNLKLMRWRLLPELDAARLASTKCLLLGAGTLGCAVARCLLGWGVRHVTFLDSGKVSYSNPVRQSLFEFADCLEGGKPKAAAAAEMLTRIFPGVTSRGVRMSIPMPGHPVSEDDANAVLADVAALDSLVEEHDVVYLLTDTRESRWLPTLMCAAKNKLLINTALGFDSYLVMRHGAGVKSGVEAVGDTVDGSNGAAGSDAGALRPGASRRGSACSEPGMARGERELGSRLGCYFCNDVMAPGNSTADRTLDQQCTVTRPGLAPIAGALAVEMMVALKHAPRGQGNALPAATSAPTPGTDPPTPLGIVPHQVRGFIANFHQVLFAAPAFPRCTACSEAVVAAYRSADRDAFLLKAFADPTYLEQSTGLTAMHEAADAAEWLGSDSDGDDF